MRATVVVEASKPVVPAYLAVTVSTPTGAFGETHVAFPSKRVALHMSVEPIEKATVPVGVPVEAVTVAE